MPEQGQLKNCVKSLRQQRAWSQEELARRAGISRAAVSAIEIQRLVPSVAAALALAGVFGCKVEDLFGAERTQETNESWAWSPTGDSCRFWHATVGARVVRFPVETTAAGILPHDGILRQGDIQLLGESSPEKTLVMASCDPAVGLLASVYERATGFRLLPIYRSSRDALALLHQDLVHIAGIHLATTESEPGNAPAAKAILGDGFSLVRLATWEEGLALQPSAPQSSAQSVLRANLRWIGREPGAGARACQDELLGTRRVPQRRARDHHGVADAIRCGWADVGVCLRLVSEQAGLGFIHLRDEAYDLCFRSSLRSDVRLKQLLAVLRSPALQRLFAPLPGYELAQTLDPRAI